MSEYRVEPYVSYGRQMGWDILTAERRMAHSLDQADAERIARALRLLDVLESEPDAAEAYAGLTEPQP